MSDIVFFAVPVGDTQLQLIVLWLVTRTIFFTFYFQFINIRSFARAVCIVTGKLDKDPKGPGEVS